MIPALISLILILLILIRAKRIFKNSKKTSAWIAAFAFLTIYLIIVGTAIYHDIYCQWDLNKYDLNMNGLFESNEINSGQEEAFKRLTNDTGRNFALFTGLIFSGLISLFVFVIGLGFEKYIKLKKE